MSQSTSGKCGSTSNTPQPEESTASLINSEMNRRTETLSPTRFSRKQEKVELQNLNDRFATYIGRVKYLETKNSELVQKLHFSEENATREMSNIKLLFESEIMDLRNTLDRETKLKNRLQLDNRRKNLTAEELKTKLDNVTRELVATTPYVARFNELNVKYSQTLIDNDKLNDTNQKLMDELKIEKKNLKDNAKTLDDVVLKKITIENKLKSVMENFKFKEEIHKQQLNDSRTFRHTEFDSEIIRLNEQFDNKLQTELITIRQKALEEVNKNNTAINDLFDDKIQHLENELQRKKNSLDAVQEDVNVANSRITELTKTIDDLLSSNNDYLRKISDLERLREDQRTKYMSDIQVLDRKLIDMQDNMSQKVQEYQDLMDIKVALDVEISAYRKLLESEERRLSITPNTSIVGSPRAKKRKLFQRDETNNSSSNIITASSTSNIDICEVCPDGQFIKLYNKGSTEFSLNGYEIVRTTTEENASTVFKFDSSVNLGAGNWLTIWSLTASKQIHKHRAGSIVMDNQSWVVGDLMVTILLNPEGHEVATHELKKTQVSPNEGYDDNETKSFYQPVKKFMKNLLLKW